MPDEVFMLNLACEHVRLC